MKEITKKEIENIVKESNKELKEEYPYLGSEIGQARNNTMHAYKSYVSQAKKFLDQMVDRANMDYENKVIQKADIDWLIDDQLLKMQDALNYVKSQLEVMKTSGLKILPAEQEPFFPFVYED